MGKSVKYSAEVRERAVRMLKEHEHEYSSRWAAIESIATRAVRGDAQCRAVGVAVGGLRHLDPASSDVESRARGLRDLMLYAVAGAVYCVPCPYRALHICWIRTPSLRRG